MSQSFSSRTTHGWLGCPKRGPRHTRLGQTSHLVSCRLGQTRHIACCRLGQTSDVGSRRLGQTSYFLGSLGRVAIGWVVLFAAGAISHRCQADSALLLLSGFDAARVESAFPPVDEDSAGELAKLVYRLRGLGTEPLESRVSEAPGFRLGDAIGVAGVIQDIKRLDVPASLVEFLEFSSLQLVTIGTASGDLAVVTTPLPSDAQRGDQAGGFGVVIEVDGEEPGEPGRPIAAAMARLRWNPKSPQNPGWRLLGQSGVDIGSLAEVASRNRRPLSAEDGDAFYSMLAAAARIARQDEVLTPSPVQPVTLLQQPEGFTGRWLRLDLETIQVTRIAVTEPRRRTQLGSDHYFQIDAVGELGDVIVKIQRPDGDDDLGPPATFENRYPVSVVAREIPEFLKQEIRARKGGDAVVSQIKVKVSVDAFFFRLWSYTTDFMEQHGGGEQFGPLLIAARIRNLEPTSTDPAGVGVIAWIAAVCVISGIVAIWLWTRRVAESDRKVRQRRKERESEQLQLP